MLSRLTIYGKCPYCDGVFYNGHECLQLREIRKQREEIEDYQKRVQIGLRFSQNGDKNE